MVRTFYFPHDMYFKQPQSCLHQENTTPLDRATEACYADHLIFPQGKKSSLQLSFTSLDFTIFIY